MASQKIGVKIEEAAGQQGNQVPQVPDALGANTPAPTGPADHPFVQSTQALLDYLALEPKSPQMEGLWHNCRHELHKLLHEFGHGAKVVGEGVAEVASTALAGGSAQD